MRIPRHAAEIAYILIGCLLIAACIVLLRVAAERSALILDLESQIVILSAPEPVSDEEAPEVALLPEPTPRFLFPIHAEDFDHFTSPFGDRDDPLSPSVGGERTNDHSGIDAVPLETVWDARVRPAAPGVVVIHWPPKGRPVPEHPGWTFKGDPERGAWIEILHDNGWKTQYLHLSWTNPDVVHEGWRVDTNDTIGRVGGSGRTTGSHLHFALIDPDGKRVNPLLHISISRVDEPPREL